MEKSPPKELEEDNVDYGGRWDSVSEKHASVTCFQHNVGDAGFTKVSHWAWSNHTPRVTLANLNAADLSCDWSKSSSPWQIR